MAVEKVTGFSKKYILVFVALFVILYIDNIYVNIYNNVYEDSPVILMGLCLYALLFSSFILSVVCFLRGSPKNASMYIAIFFAVVMRVVFNAEVYALDMNAKGYAVAYLPGACPVADQNGGVSVCYLQHRELGVDALVFDPSDEMARPASQWSTNLIEDLEKQMGVRSSPRGLAFSLEEQCRFGDTKLVSNHIYYVNNTC